MKKIWDKFRSIFKINKKLFLSLFVITIIGIIAGSLLVTVLSEQDQALTTQFINDYFTNIRNNQVDSLSLLQNVVISNILFVLGIWLLGISVIGIPIIFVLYFAKTFVLGFSVASLISIYKIKGGFYALFYVFPHHIINLLVYMIVIIYAFAFSTKLIHALMKKQTLDIKSMRNKYLMVLGVMAGVIVITAIIEAFITPKLMKFAITLWK